MVHDKSTNSTGFLQEALLNDKEFLKVIVQRNQQGQKFPRRPETQAVYTSSFCKESLLGKQRPPLPHYLSCQALLYIPLL